jgi:hypothetical protein
MKVAEIAVSLIAFICGAVVIYLSINYGNAIKLSCNLSEINPDFSHIDREKCRVMRGHKL